MKIVIKWGLWKTYSRNIIGEILKVGTGKTTKIVNLSEPIINIFGKELMSEFLSPKIWDIREH